MKRTPSISRIRGLAAIALLFAIAPFLPMTAHVQAAGPSLSIVSPAGGETVTTDDITVEVTVNDFNLDCSQVGRPDADGVGHLHAMIDGMTMGQLTNFYCDTTFTISGLGLEPGPHTIIVTLASNTHMDMMDTAQQVEIDFQPANARPLPAAEDLGKPGVTLVSPLDGETVSSIVTIQVEPVNFNPTADLEGKPNVPGYGHYHVFVDTPMSMSMSDMASPESMDMATPGSMDMASPAADHSMGDMSMMSMAGMVAMPGANTFDLDLTAWGPGTHTIWIEPVQNDHTMFAEFDHIEFTVVVQ